MKRKETDDGRKVLLALALYHCEIATNFLQKSATSQKWNDKIKYAWKAFRHERIATKIDKMVY